jgi:hypothetical protein
MRARIARRPTALRVALAVAALAIVAVGSALLTPPRSSTATPRGAAGVVLSNPHAGQHDDRSPAPPPLPAGAAPAARAFVHDYLAALTAPPLARSVRFATDDLRERIAAAGVRLPPTPHGPAIGALTIEARTPDLVAVHAAATVAGMRQDVRFVMARTRSGWLVADIDDPEAP